jgi:hypothetical protein
MCFLVFEEGNFFANRALKRCLTLVPRAAEPESNTWSSSFQGVGDERPSATQAEFGYVDASGRRPHRGR